MKLMPTVLLLLGWSALAAAAPPPARPNVVIVFCDDLGYGDIGPFGAQGIQTPNLDRLAAEGIKFTRFYVAQAVCSASRAALLTGCYPNRIGIQGALGPKATIGIADGEMTLGELAKSQGYATAIVGKWHLGHLPQFLPVRHGFDEYLGLPYSNDMWPNHPDFHNLPPEVRRRRAGFPPLPLVEGDRVIDSEVTSDEQRQLTARYTERAVQFIDRHHQAPFLLYLAHSMPHVPLHASDRFQGKSARGLFGDVVEEIDWSVGQVLDALARHNLNDRTLVIFTSDNGPWLSYGNHAGSAGPLREGKGTAWEGGVREPLLARWTGVIPAASECGEPAMTIDLFPTIARLIGGSLPSHTIDGLDIWPLLSGQPGARSPHESLYFYYADNQLQAVSSGPWKLYLPHEYRSLRGGQPGHDGRPGQYKQYRIERPELYHVVDDLGETTDRAAEQPELVQRLLSVAEKARAELGDSLTQRTAAGARPVGRAIVPPASGGR